MLVLLCVVVVVQLLSHVWLWDPMNCSPPNSSIHGISQVRILKWVAIFSSRGSSWPRDWTCVSWVAGSLLQRKWILYHWATRYVPTMWLQARYLTSVSFRSCLWKMVHIQITCVNHWVHYVWSIKVAIIILLLFNMYNALGELSRWLSG